ncbi:MAG: hypothetical protein ACLR8Y_04815 [Alistipes indistinctus]
MLRQLAGQTAIYGISSIVSRLLNYLLTPFLTRIATTGEYGVITDMYALIPFANGGADDGDGDRLFPLRRQSGRIATGGRRSFRRPGGP